MIGGLPSELFKDPSVLIVGSGSFGAVDCAAVSAKEITSVEIDPVIFKNGIGVFRPEKYRPSKNKMNIVIDDAKHSSKIQRSNMM